MMHPIHRGFITITVLVFSLLVAACGGGGGGSLASGGIGGTGVTSGTVTGFGSIFVNGIEFETDGASRNVDDVTDISNGRDDNQVLGIGMVVTITGTVNADGVSGTADSIFYDDEVKGPVIAAPDEDPDGLSKTLDIFNFTVVIGRDTTVFEKTDYDSIAQNDVLEVSGYFDTAGKLLATRVEKEGVLALGNSKVDIKGTVSGFNGVDTFTLGGVTVSFDGATVFEDLPGTVSNGQRVEARGILDTATSMSAIRIQAEDDGFGNNVEKISIEGIVTNFNGASDFKVAGQRVNASSAGFKPVSLATTIGNGDKVEVEGPISNGRLNAKKVELRGGDARISAVVVSKNNAAGTVTLQVVLGQPAITVSTNQQTQIEDNRDGVEPFAISGIATDDFLDVEGFIDGSGNFIATQIERDGLDDTELRGPVDVPPTAGSTSFGSVSILGVIIDSNNSTAFEDASETSINGATFFAQVIHGDLVEFRDRQPADGIADKVSFEN